MVYVQIGFDLFPTKMQMVGNSLTFLLKMFLQVRIFKYMLDYFHLKNLLYWYFLQFLWIQLYLAILITANFTMNWQFLRCPFIVKHNWCALDVFFERTIINRWDLSIYLLTIWLFIYFLLVRFFNGICNGLI